MASLQGMQGQGRWVENFAEEVSKWQSVLDHTEAVLSDWLEVQHGWTSLQRIFLGSGDIRTQLPDDCSRFGEIDQNWRFLMVPL
jgi:dynein heavy chain